MAALAVATFANAQQTILTLGDLDALPSKIAVSVARIEAAVKITDVPSVEAVRWQYQQKPQPARSRCRPATSIRQCLR